jgi:hypothetical protein
MARLQAHLTDLTSPKGRLTAAKALMDHVYGHFDPSKHTSATWQPRPLADNKSRYLWTDAFGVVNYISLAANTGDRGYLDQADALIHAVHDTLGRERPGGHRSRRLGAATDDAPTRGGLRIGKVHAEGHPDGDGMYYHYLTKYVVVCSFIATSEQYIWLLVDGID